MFDLVIRGATVVDPLSGSVSEKDVGILDGLIAEVAPSIADSGAARTIGASGLILQPGIIDTHLHLSPSPLGQRMAVQAGVTAAIEMAGPIDKVLDDMANSGCGLTVAVLNAILPGQNVSSANPGTDEINGFIDQSLASGAFGVKLLGGHYPLTPEASRAYLAAAHDRGVYMAWHAGSTTAGSNLKGLEEAIELAEGRPFHLAHLNAYCRGGILPAALECARAAELLEAHPEIVTESYLSARNGCPLGTDENGIPLSAIVRINLKRLGLPENREGMLSAIKAGELSVIRPENGILELITGKAGAQWFESAPGPKDGSFDHVNPAVSRVFFATQKRAGGEFLVDAISTDGGAIPRNVIVDYGLSLVNISALTAVEFAAKTSLIPARMLGLAAKGFIAPGADADITIYDPAARKAVHAFSSGRQILASGEVVGSGGTVLCTSEGEDAVKKRGLSAQILSCGIPALKRSFGKKTA
ncbi:amidohydrolase [Sutterella faecalis]|uniref:Amidohydrolase n=2 Tax=Sutterella TaxID=40544 RepID=A0AAI9SCI5_9BURK|nr:MULTISPECIES: amidohydrolase [Sutterella]KAB7650655.1 amidohydrolase [Sutterella seckii]QDA54042.1 amidohydrolase [Sutterella faecalis]